MTDLNALIRDLTLLPRGGKAWGVAYSRYRRTAHWVAIRDRQLELHPFCEMELLMNGNKIHADEVHHRDYTQWFKEFTGVHLVSISKANHLLWEQRRMRRQRR